MTVLLGHKAWDDIICGLQKSDDAHLNVDRLYSLDETRVPRAEDDHYIMHSLK